MGEYRTMHYTASRYRAGHLQARMTKAMVMSYMKLDRSMHEAVFDCRV